MPGEKTEKATPKRKQDERKKGNVFKSNEIVVVASLFAQFFLLKMLASFNIETLGNTIKDSVSMAATTTELTQNTLNDLLVDSVIVFAKAAMPVLLVGVLIAIVLTMLQTKMLFSAKSFAFKANRLNPLSGLKKIFSMRSLVELLKSIIKIIVLLYILYLGIRDELIGFTRLLDMSFGGALAMVGNLLMKIVQNACIIFLFLAAADYLYQWWEYEKNLRMSKQEIKDEYKQLEGDPQVKGRIRQIQQQRAQRRMMQKVPQADVVIRNPTHYAVALQYDQKKHRAPVVIAKGADELALRIVRVAEENDVYITENRPLARGLFEAVEVDHEIPEQFYKTVAQVLAFVYSLRKKEVT